MEQDPINQIFSDDRTGPIVSTAFAIDRQSESRIDRSQCHILRQRQYPEYLTGLTSDLK